MLSYWGGYEITFKVISRESAEKVKNDLDSMRRSAIQIGGKGKMSVDISKHEHTIGRNSIDVDGFRVFVYTPEMIVAEKLRAICQQSDSYTTMVRKHKAPRARDFFDICIAIDHFEIDLTSQVNLELIRSIFAAKHVPISLLSDLDQDREFHQDDFSSLKATVPKNVDLQPFDFYFQRVLVICRALKAAGIEDLPSVAI